MSGRLTFGSLFAGIGGFDLGFHRAGFDCRWQVEIDDRAGNVLAHRWPETKRYKDVRDVGRTNLEAVDVITGGFPCQDLSVAGKRAGLDGERSGLWFEFHRVLEEMRPAWCVIENVPGLLSSNGGRDFAVILRGLAELGYGIAWRVLDSQYFGVPQRRRRVFIVGHLGDGRAAEVLFEPQGGEGDTQEGKEAGQRVARPLRAQSQASHREDSDTYIAFSRQDDGRDATENKAPTMRVGTSLGDRAGMPGNLAIAWHENQVGEIQFGNITKALKSNASHNYQGIGVRRLTPRECERLQGFPDDWTLVDGTSDSARYRQLGNAVTVNVIEWLARRIAEASRER